MANTITNFLVGIGFDYDKKSADAIGSGIDSISSKALQLGSVVAGAFGIKALSTDFANAQDMLGKFSETLGLVPEDVQAFGNALATEGGSLESFMAQIESIEQARARIKVGDVGFFAPAGKAGLDPNAIADAESATEAYLGLADAFATMSQQERLNAADALGLDRASILLLSQGRDAVEELVGKFRDIRPVTEESSENAAAFNRSWVEAKANIGGVTDIISNELLPVITNVTDSINSWFSDDRLGRMKAILEVTKNFFGGDNAEEAAKATGLPEWLFKREGVASDTGDFISEKASNVGSLVSEKASDIAEVFTTPPPATVSPYPGYGGASTSNSPYGAIGTQPAAASAPTPTTQNVNVTLQLDGAALDKRTVRVVDGMAQTAIDDIASSTGG